MEKENLYNSKKNNDEEHIKIVLGKHFIKQEKNTNSKKQVIQMSKAIVFDLDETIGHFTHLTQIVNAMEELIKRELKHEEFNELLDLYPEFLRPGIIIILDFLYSKTQCELVKLYLYTNNKYGKEWVQKIVKYIESKIQTVNEKPLFLEIVYVFKHKNKIIDFRRKSNEKTHSEIIECMTIVEPTTEICFIDNMMHEKVCSDKVYYIKPRAYFHNLQKQEIVQRLLNYIPVSVAPYNRDKLHSLLYTHCKENNCPKTLAKDESEVTRKIMYHIRTFLYFTKHSSCEPTKHSSCEPTKHLSCESTILIIPNSKKSCKNKKQQNSKIKTKKLKTNK